MTDKQDLAVALHQIEELKKLHDENVAKIEELEKWKETCTHWAAWWAGVCAAVMTMVTLIRTYWDEFVKLFGSVK